MKVIAVFHGEKASGLAAAGKPPEIVANTPLTVEGMEKIFGLVEDIRPYGPFAAAFCSRLARAAASMSVLSIELDVDFQSMKTLGQHGSKDGDMVCYYPGYETEGYSTWQQQGIQALSEISKGHATDTVLVVTHKPVIGGLLAYTRGITDEDGVKGVVREVAKDTRLTAKGFVVFELSGKGLRVVEP